MNVEVYLANLHSGGALVVAESFLMGLMELSDEPCNEATHWTIVLSPTLHNRLSADTQRKILDLGYVIVRRDRPWNAMLHLRRRPDLRISLFGPTYLLRSAGTEVVGFADGSLVFPSSTPATAWLRIRNRIKLELLRGYKAHVVQTNRMKAALDNKFNFVSTHVLRIGPHPVFKEAVSKIPCRSTTMPYRNEIFLLYPARAFPHKRHDLIPSLCERLTERLQKEVIFQVTLTSEEMKQTGLAESSSVSNLGVLSAEMLAEAYINSDVVVFLSENETFSYVPLEAQIVGRPLVAPNLEYMREYQNDSVFLFDPGNIESAVRATIHSLSRTRISGAQLVHDTQLLSSKDYAREWLRLGGIVR